MAAAKIDRSEVGAVIKGVLDELGLDQIKSWSFSTSPRKQRVWLTLVCEGRLADEQFARIESKLEQALVGLDLRIKIRPDLGARRSSNIERPAAAASSYERDVLYRDALRSLPLGIELLKLQRYELPLRDGALDFALLKLYVPERRESEIAGWEKAFERRHGIKVFIQRAAADESLKGQLETLASTDRFIDRSEKDSVSALIAPFERVDEIGREIVRRASLPAHLPDRSHELFFTVDPAHTRDMEDALSAKRLPDGSIQLSIAFVDVTWFLDAGGEIDRHAQELGATIYGSHRIRSTLGRELAFSLASFNPGEKRSAWLVDLHISPEGEVSLMRDPYRALVASARRYTPAGLNAIVEGRKAESEELGLALEAASLLNAGRTGSGRWLRLKGEGAGYQLVSEAMIAGKEAIARFLHERSESGAVYRVHAGPTAEIKRQYAAELRQLGVECNSRCFDHSLAFAEVLEKLQQSGLNSQPGGEQARRANRLMNQILDTFLTASRFDALNLGHHALNVGAYAEIKPRDASGITNQFQLLGITEGAGPIFDRAEVERRAELRNRAQQDYDWRAYRFRFLEMLREKLELIGDEFQARVKHLKNGSALVEVAGFTKWGYVERSAGLRPGQRLRVRLEGFDVEQMRFRFSVVTSCLLKGDRA